MSNKKYDKLQNYTTSIKPEQTIMEIEKMLSVFGATKIMKEYDEKNRPIFLAFMIKIEGKGEIPIRLPVKIHEVLMAFDEEIKKGLLPRKYSGDVEQALRVGWRIKKDWLLSQLTEIRLRQVKPLEIFLSYIYDYSKQETLYEKIERDGLKAIGYSKEE